MRILLLFIMGRCWADVFMPPVPSARVSGALCMLSMLSETLSMSALLCNLYRLSRHIMHCCLGVKRMHDLAKAGLPASIMMMLPPCLACSLI